MPLALLNHHGPLSYGKTTLLMALASSLYSFFNSKMTKLPFFFSFLLSPSLTPSPHPQLHLQQWPLLLLPQIYLNPRQPNSTSPPQCGQNSQATRLDRKIEGGLSEPEALLIEEGGG